MNKDFYDKLPGIVCEDLEKVIIKYGKEQWFDKAWEEYRQHILSTSLPEQRMPGFIFNKYISKGE